MPTCNIWCLTKKTCLTIFVITSLLIIYEFLENYTYISCKYRVKNNINFDEVAVIKLRLEIATIRLKTLQIKHKDLLTRVRMSPRFVNTTNSLLLPLLPGLQTNGSIEAYETTRRNIYMQLKDLGDYINSKLLLALFDSLDVGTKQDFLVEINQRKRSVVAEQERLAAKDGYEAWRREEAHRVSGLVQRRLRRLQHPRDCSARRKVVCNMDSCGFGCSVHHIAFCLMFAYGTDRTLLLSSSDWRYSPGGWHKIFHRLTNCTGTFHERVWEFTVEPNAKNIYLMPISYYYSISPNFTEFTSYHVPKDLLKRIVRFNGDPASWWVGQILKYILNPQKLVEKLISHTIAKMYLRSRIVGVHVRRMNSKVVPAAFQELCKYMEQVDEYYKQLELTETPTRRSVYLATDEPRVINDDIANYSHKYIFFYTLASFPSDQYSSLNLTGLLADLYSLASCEHVVCTFSSHICRLVYELIQITRDATNRIYSLDHFYYFYDRQPNYYVAVLNHTYKGYGDTVEFRIGDIILAESNYPTTNGTVLRTGDYGVIPWYKTVKIYEKYPYIL